ncbi:uncharacterized protein LOC111372767 isoform X2 [Olea europaea var. sylvestris]|uniref:Uncharacterized protein n=1 Tax=Olea europaea subsp. europaea TaxID=158383 RepID=A0A8S0RJY1_OLEEU|nr:uncharacterized protein LOC111372767 isoform X2 [Olea europaea var. sylvestris]CAA2979135.1 Hypothetical predicted protein [Olea europaea subsp. europaea]
MGRTVQSFQLRYVQGIYCVTSYQFTALFLILLCNVCVCVYIFYSLQKASSANIVNRSKKKYNHRIGSRPFSYTVEEMVEDGSKFPEVDTFEFAYAGKNKCWTYNDEMLIKESEYLV